MTDLAFAAALLRAAGWTVTEPPAAEIPRVEVGQVWRSPKPGVEDRTVLRIGNSNKYPWDPRAITFTTEALLKQLHHNVLSERAFIAWARKSGARPVEE